jgi:hypothetical protein
MVGHTANLHPKRPGNSKAQNWRCDRGPFLPREQFQIYVWSDDGTNYPCSVPDIVVNIAHSQRFIEWLLALT